MSQLLTIIHRITREFRDKWLREGYGTTPFSMIQRLNHYCTTVTYSEMSLPKVEWIEAGKTVAAFGYTIEVDDFAAMYRAVLKDAQEIFEELTAGISTKVDGSLKGIVDSVVTRDPEYSFLGNQNASMMSMRSRLLTHLATQTNYVIGTRDGKIQWNHLELTKFMSKCHSLNEKLMFLM